ncbi:GNAT family N-acetyltransferase [Streptomyces sp. NPDC094032]|uniref:GNAT family N-acetyltransferase n=1 Tax=Streptomyces sp. NPDC094032 TaxID=3155308 RepID=UPI00332168C4
MGAFLVRSDVIGAVTDAHAGRGGPALRAWEDGDAEALVRHHGDPQMRRWLATHLDSAEQARAWIAEQNRGREAGSRVAFAVVEVTPGADRAGTADGVDRAGAADGAGGGGVPGEPVGHVALTRTAGVVRVGYWTAASARGRGIASRALALAAAWASAAPDSPFTGDRLELVHAVGNDGSCRTALSGGFRAEGDLPAAPPERPRAMHLHVYDRG